MSDPAWLELAGDMRYIDALDLGGSLLGGDGFLLLFAGAQSCDYAEDAQCVLSRVSGDIGLRLCIAGSGRPSADIHSCDNPEPTCSAVIAAKTEHCGTIELLTLRRWTPASDPSAQTLLEVRRDGRSLYAEPSTGSRLDSGAFLRIGAAPKRKYTGTVALVALFSGNFDDQITCRLERFVLESLKAAGLRDEVDPPACD